MSDAEIAQQLLVDTVARLRAMLKHYGCHYGGCPTTDFSDATCTCGWDELRKNLETTPP